MTIIAEGLVIIAIAFVVLSVVIKFFDIFGGK